MVDKSRIVKRIKVPAEVFNKVKPKDRLDAFWDYIVSVLKRNREIRIDVTKIKIGMELEKILKKRCDPFVWLNVSPSSNPDLKGFEVEVCAGWNLNNRRKSAEERVKTMLTGESSFYSFTPSFMWSRNGHSP